MQIQGQYQESGSLVYNSAAAEEVVQVKTGAGKLFGLMVTNFNAAARFLYVFDNTASSGTPICTPIPMQLLAAVGSAVVVNMPWPILFSTGLRIATSSTGSTFTASAANDIRISVLFK